MASFRKTVAGTWRAEVFVKGVRDSAVRDTKAEAQIWALKRDFLPSAIYRILLILHQARSVK